MGEPKGQSQAMAASQFAEQQAQQNAAQQQQLFQQIQPFAQALMSLGLDPTKFMQSALGQSMLGQMRQGVSENYAGARNNLWESLGGAGLAGTGVGTGPLANLYSEEAQKQANIMQQLPQLGLNLGLQGAGLLSDQQALLQPADWSQLGIWGYTKIPQSNWLGSILGATGQALGGSDLTKLFGGGGTSGTTAGTGGTAELYNAYPTGLGGA